MEESVKDDPVSASDLQTLVDSNNKEGLPLRRPMNAFLIFCKKHRALVRERNPHLDNRSVTRILGELWANLPITEKDSYLNLAKQYRDAFMKANPDFHWHGNNKRETQAAFKPVHRLPGPSRPGPPASNTAIVPGKLADPSNMGGLGLLLMAGGATSGIKSSDMSGLMSPPATSVSKNVIGEKGQPDNVALLQLAEMCSSQLESNPAPKAEPAVNQTPLPGSYAMTPPWTPQYEGQSSPSHDPTLSPSEHNRDCWPLDLSKPTPATKEGTNQKEASFELTNQKKESFVLSYQPNQLLELASSRKDLFERPFQHESQRAFTSQAGSQGSYASVHQIPPFLYSQQNRGVIPHATESINTMPHSSPKVVAPPSNPNVTSTMPRPFQHLVHKEQHQSIGAPYQNLETTAQFKNSTSRQILSNYLKKDKVTQVINHHIPTDSKPGQIPESVLNIEKMDMPNMPSGRMIVDKMIETVFSKEMQQTKQQEFDAQLGDSHKSSSSATEGRLSALFNMDKVSKSGSLTFSEIQETLIRKAMEDSSAFIHPNPLPNNPLLDSKHPVGNFIDGHLGMDLAVRNFRPIGSSGIVNKPPQSSPNQFVPVMLPSVGNTEAPVQHLTQGRDDHKMSAHPGIHSVHVTSNRGYEDMDLTCKEDLSSPEKNEVKQLSRAEIVSDAVDLICREELSGYDSEETPSKLDKFHRAVRPRNQPIRGTVTKLKDSIESQLATHLMASAGVLPLQSETVKSEVKPEIKDLKLALICTNEQEETSGGKTRRKRKGFRGNGANDSTKQSTDNININTTGKTIKNVIKVETEFVEKALPLKKRGRKHGNINTVTKELVDESSKEKKPRRRRRNVMEMTIDPYGERIDGNQVEEAVAKGDEGGSGDNPEDDDITGVRKSKRRNRGQKYQALLSQGLLQAGRHKRTESNSESNDAEVAVVRRQRKSTTSDNDNNLTSFDLEAEIASLPACQIEPGVQRATQPGGRGKHRGKPPPPPQPQSQVKELNIAELRQLTKVPATDGSTTTITGSQKRKARRMKITHLVVVNKTGTENADPNSTGSCQDRPQECSTVQSSPISEKTPPQVTTQAICAVNFATLVDVAVAENEKIRNLSEVLVSCT